MQRVGVLIVVLLVVGSSYGGIYTFNSLEMNQSYMKAALFAPADAPSDSSPGNGQSFVKFAVEFSRVVNESVVEGPSSAYALLLKYEDIDSATAIADDGNRHICCSADLVASGKCSKIGHIFYSGNTTSSIFPIEIEFNLDKQDPEKSVNTVRVDQVINIEVTGMYYLFLVNCPRSGAGAVYVKGEIEFMNPYGYLPGELYYYMPFYGSMALFYLFLGLLWLLICLKFRRSLLNVQKWIGVVIAAGIIEMATLYFDDLGYNNSGKNFVAAMMVGVLFSTVKRTISRLLVLVVSMGYGVVKPTLGEEKTKIILLGVVYTVFAAALNVVDLMQRTTVFTFSTVLFLVFPVALFDTIFYWWIFMSLTRTIQQLAARKQPLKLSMYKWLLGVLVASGVVSAIIIVIQMGINMNNDQDTLWKSTWGWNAFWHILYFLILLAIAILWRPTTNNSRYAYSEMNQDEEEIPMEGVVNNDNVAQRTKSKEDNPTEVKLSPIPEFTIEDDDDNERITPKVD